MSTAAEFLHADSDSSFAVRREQAPYKSLGKWLPLFAIVPCVLLAAISLHSAFSVALVDSQDNNWGPARALLHGADPYSLYLRCGRCAKPPFFPPVAPMYPASALVLLWPLAALPWPVAKATWATLNILLGAGLVAALHRLFVPGAGWRVLVVTLMALLASTPFLNNLGNGQHAIFALAFFPAALWAERRGHPVLASVLLAVSWFKYSLTFPLSLLLVLRGRFSMLLGAVAIHTLLTLFAAAWAGTNPIELLMEPLRVIRGVGSVGHLEVFGLATRLGLTSRLVPMLAAIALTLAVMTAIWRGRAQDDLQLLSLLALFGYAVMYHYPYDLVILVVPLFYVVSRGRSWNALDFLQRAWTVMLAVLLIWTWYADHPIQLLRMHRVGWLVAAYPSYYAALAAWFYATLLTGIAVVGRRKEPAPKAEIGNFAIGPVGLIAGPSMNVVSDADGEAPGHGSWRGIRSSRGI